MQLKRQWLAVFRGLYVLAAALALFAAALIVSSFFIADRVPQSTSSFILHALIGSFFGATGILLLGVERHSAQIGKLVRTLDQKRAQELQTIFARLLVYLSLGGLMLAAILLILTYAIVARIDQGFAVFG